MNNNILEYINDLIENFGYSEEDALTVADIFFHEDFDNGLEVR